MTSHVIFAAQRLADGDSHNIGLHPLGRFITQDTYRGNPRHPSSLNLYAYVGNNPVNYVDPTGHIAYRLEGGQTFYAGPLPAMRMPNIPVSYLIVGGAGAALGAMIGDVSPGLTTLNQAKSKDKNQDTSFETPSEALDDAMERVGDLGAEPSTLTDELGNTIGVRSRDGKRGWRIDDGHVNWWDTDDGHTDGGHSHWENGEKVPNATDAKEQYEDGVSNGRGRGGPRPI